MDINDWYPVGRSCENTQTDTKGRRPCTDRKRDWI